jgi:hypothetical protein
VSLRKYTKANLEELVFCQLENLSAMHDLLSVMKTQTELLRKANKKLRDEVVEVKAMYSSCMKSKKT